MEPRQFRLRLLTSVAGNVGLAGGNLTTVLETSMPSASGLPAYTDVDSR